MPAAPRRAAPRRLLHRHRHRGGAAAPAPPARAGPQRCARVRASPRARFLPPRRECRCCAAVPALLLPPLPAGAPHPKPRRGVTHRGGRRVPRGCPTRGCFPAHPPGLPPAPPAAPLGNDMLKPFSHLSPTQQQRGGGGCGVPEGRLWGENGAGRAVAAAGFVPVLFCLGTNIQSRRGLAGRASRNSAVCSRQTLRCRSFGHPAPRLRLGQALKNVGSRHGPSPCAHGVP